VTVDLPALLERRESISFALKNSFALKKSFALKDAKVSYVF